MKAIQRNPKRFGWIRMILLGFLGTIVLVVIAGTISVWPSAMVLRLVFSRGGESTNAALEKFVPDTVIEELDIAYRKEDKDAKLDIYYPANIKEDTTDLPLVIWIHGGGLISGAKEQVANYCKILAAENLVVAAIDYSVAPEAKYPTPVIQTNAAISYLYSQAKRWKIRRDRIFFAGDSGGSQIAAQMGNVIVDSAYAALLNIEPAILPQQLGGLILFCGPYDLALSDSGKKVGWFMNTVLWAYSGTKEYYKDAYFRTASVIDYLDTKFPPAFISVGNADPLKAHSFKLAKKLNQLGGTVDTLFFPTEYTPALPHEYQFNLETNEGKLALNRVTEFIKRIK
jgi:acetyl esterase/lipase